MCRHRASTQCWICRGWGLHLLESALADSVFHRLLRCSHRQDPGAATRNTSHTDITDVLLDFPSAVSRNAAQYQFFDNYGWVVASMGVDGRSVEPSDTSQNPLGPLQGKHVMHVTMVLVPSRVGARALHLRVYNVTSDDPPLANATVRTTVTP